MSPGESANRIYTLSDEHRSSRIREGHLHVCYYRCYHWHQRQLARSVVSFFVISPSFLVSLFKDIHIVIIRDS